jgi:ribosomal protein L32
MAQNVKRGRGSNQYADKLEAVPVEERRLPRLRRRGMSKSGKTMATPGKPFQCPSCGEVHATGYACQNCQPPVPMAQLTCPGCGQAMLPSAATLCDDCEELALIPALEPVTDPYPGPMRPRNPQPATAPVGAPAAPVLGSAPMGRPVPQAPPQGPPAAYPAPSGSPRSGGQQLPPRRLPSRRTPEA